MARRSSGRGHPAERTTGEGASLTALDPFASLVGFDPVLLRLKANAREIAETEVNVLIRGETGTGKDLFARAIHAASPRRERSLTSVHCATLRDDLARSELFGPAVEPSTGATHGRPGLLAATDGGTLVLDEIGDLPFPDQDRLRQFLDVGGADTRLIATTHRDLDELCEKDRFRAELLYRLRVVTLDVPPLRERAGDVELLIDVFQKELADRHGKRPVVYNRSARKALRRYGWPGNVRELRNLCEEMILTRSGEDLSAEDLPLPVRFPGIPQRDKAQLPVGGIRLDDWIEDLIRQSLVHTGGNRSQAARLLGITRDTLNYRIKKYGIKG